MTNNYEWTYLQDELKGTMPKIWLQRDNQTALFKWCKDETQNSRKIANELEAYRIATILNLRCAKAETLTWHGQQGVLSYNVHTDTQKYLYISVKECAATLRKHAATYHKSSQTLPPLSFGGLSMKYIQNNIPNVEKDMVNMLFFDCLTSNADRHGDNRHLKIDNEANTVVSLCDLFDHDNAFRPELELKHTGCAIRYYENSNINQKDMFKNISADYPRQVGELLYNTQQLAVSRQLNDLCVSRLSQMDGYYAFCKNLKRTHNRETNITDRFTTRQDKLVMSPSAQIPNKNPELDG
jgi:hypothetical protein